MVTIHEKTAQSFNTLGLGALLPGSCVVREEVNGAYELEMSHPYEEDGKWKRIEKGRILYASTPRGRQPFRIYRVKPNMSSIEVNAKHIFYDLLDNQCSEISFSGTASAALAALQEAFAYAMPFSFATDISISGALTTGRMNPVQALLSDDDDTTSFVKGFGGELLRDGFNISLKAAMGQDRDVAIRYGKNLVGLEVTEDESDVKTRIICYGSDGSTVVESPYINEYVYPKIYTLEDAGKTISELKEEARALLDGGADLPLVNIKVDFIQLSKTVEYADYAPLEDVFLGDIVTVINQKMGFAKKARVISYEWDSLLEQYNEVELGDFMPTLATSVTSGARSGAIASAASVTVSAVSAMLQAHIDDKDNPHGVTAKQTGGSAGGGTGVLNGSAEPDASIGENGDLYLQTVSESEYTPLESISVDGTQYFDFGFIPNQDTRVVIDMTVELEGGIYGLFGARTKYQSNEFSFWSEAETTTSTNYANESKKMDLTIAGRHIIDKNKNVTSIDGEVLYTASSATFSTGNTFTLFAIHQDAGVDSRYGIGKLHTFAAYSNGTMIRNIIPVKDVNGIGCCYDRINAIYYYGQGTGDVVAGVELPKETVGGVLWLKQNGTWTQVLKGAA